MIHKIEVENFMSLKNASVELEPLTVFIGPNGSGKSAIFKALVLLSKLLNGQASGEQSSDWPCQGLF